MPCSEGGASSASGPGLDAVPLALGAGVEEGGLWCSALSFSASVNVPSTLWSQHFLMSLGGLVTCLSTRSSPQTHPFGLSRAFYLTWGIQCPRPQLEDAPQPVSVASAVPRALCQLIFLEPCALGFAVS